MHYQTKKIFMEAFSNVKKLIFNLIYFSMRSPYDNDWAMLRNLILSFPTEYRTNYSEELEFIESVKLDCLSDIILPYPKKETENMEPPLQASRENGLPFVMHNRRLKLFFPSYASVSDALYGYKVLVEREGLLGTGMLKKSPHCYQDDKFKVEKGDVLLDVGCAEAIFALDNIDKVSKAYLFECSPEWFKPLKYTFAPYEDKTVLVKKLVGDKTNSKTTTLIDILRKDMSDDVHFFVKMDIEGWERLVLQGNRDFFSTAKIKLSCCVYHRQDDAKEIEKILKDMGYKTRFSEGYMLPTMNGIHFPYFRHGIIYAQNY